MKNLPAVAIIEKNRISSTGAWLVLLEVIVTDDLQFTLCHNTEDITWNGKQWIAFPFEIDDVEESGKGEMPQFNIRVSNITQQIQQYLEQADGGVDSKVIIRVVHSDHLDQTTPFLEEAFSVISTATDTEWVTFTLGGSQRTNRRVPWMRIMKNFCQFKYGRIQCGVSAATLAQYPTCNRTLAACRQRGNSKRFNGEPSIPTGGLYAN